MEKMKKSPWGVGLLVDKTLETLKSSTVAPSVILTNALMIAQSKQLDLEQLKSEKSMQLSEAAASFVRQLLERLRMPNVVPAKLLEETFVSVWVKKDSLEKKERSTPSKKGLAGINKPASQKKAESVPVVVVRRARKI